MKEEEGVKEIKLHGSRLSSFCATVHHALRLKGVVCEYVEEDLRNKCQVLLELNPVHKEVPVLMVDGKPIAESFVILQYIDDMWKEPSFLPEDPYMRAVGRFLLLQGPPLPKFCPPYLFTCFNWSSRPPS